MDMDYFKRLYSPVCKELLLYIQQVCDQQDYEGSLIYDEYPDRVALERVVDQVHDMAAYMEAPKEADTEGSGPIDEMFSQCHCEGCHKNSWLRDLITVLLYQELMHRRQMGRRMN